MKGNYRMKAVIMAGGKGTRLSTVLKDIPKPMVDLAGRPLLEHQIINLKENGITDIILVIGYLGNVIQDYFKDGSSLGVNISYFKEEKPLGTAGALWYLKEQLQDDFILLFGDLFVNINFTRFYDFHKKNGARITLYTHPNSHPYDSDIIVSDENNVVVDWSLVDKEDYLLAMERSPIKDIEIKHLLKKALTDKVNDREMYMKGIDHSYYYEGYAVYKTEEL